MNAEQKVVAITGASQGIGADLVPRISRSRLSGRCQLAVDQARCVGRSACRGWRHRRPGRGRASRSGAVDKFGRLDTLINNAGIFIGKPFTEYTEDDFTRKISVNLAGFFYVSQCAVRQMLKQGSGHIVNMTTTLVGQPVKSVPSALASLTKGGLDAVTRSLAIEYADKGIRVNAVAPGVIKTPMHAPETHDFLAKLHPMGRMGETREVVEAILYLESAGFVTGETLHVDGGAHAGHW